MPYTITLAFLESGRSSLGNWSPHQLRMLGVLHPPPRDFKDKLIGTVIPTQLADAFLEAKESVPVKPPPRWEPEETRIRNAGIAHGVSDNTIDDYVLAKKLEWDST